jgi:hypothetical protein
MQPWVVLGVADSKRTRGLTAASAACGVAVQWVDWRDWLADPGALDAALQAPCRFKIEPPGDDPVAHLQLLHDGCALLGRSPVDAPERGELLAADAWFAGFSRALQRLARQLAALPHVQVVNAPDDILAMTDKLACQQRLQAHEVPTPPLLGTVRNHDHLMALLDAHGTDRVFVKARYGSSAAGVVAYRRNRRGQQQATTTAQMHGDGRRLFNVKRISSYRQADEVRRVIDLVAAQEAYAEVWIPKPRCGNGHFDLRVLTFAGRAAHRVARIGQRPMTNLHLDSARADPAQLLTPDDLTAMTTTAERAARAFAHSTVIGFDLVAQRGRAHVLEANAFGDLLPGLLWQGRDTYATALSLP